VEEDYVVVNSRSCDAKLEGNISAANVFVPQDSTGRI
jgi:hypothetical protein